MRRCAVILSSLCLASVAACGDGGTSSGDTAADTAVSETDVAPSDTSDRPDTEVVPADTTDASEGDGVEDVAPERDAEGETAIDTADPDVGDTLTDGAPEDTFEVVEVTDTGPVDAGETTSDVADTADTTPVRTVIVPGFCPSSPTAPGLYRGTLAGNLNDIGGACGLSAPGRDGAVRVELEPGQTLTARYRHAGDGVLYLLDNCPVIGTCQASSDQSVSGEESLTWTWTGAVRNPVYIILDSDDLEGAQTFELDLEVSGP